MSKKTESLIKHFWKDTEKNRGYSDKSERKRRIKDTGRNRGYSLTPRAKRIRVESGKLEKTQTK